MRFYLDQMLKVDVAETLRSHGFDVTRASEIGQDRASDDEILSFCIAENRVLITFDDDFGNWAILPLARHPGVIRLKIHPPTTAAALELLVPFLKETKFSDLKDRLVILSKKNVRWIRTSSD